MRIMARTRVRPATPRPRRPAAKRSRPGVGKRKPATSTLTSFAKWSSRPETAGIAIIVLGVVAGLVVLPGIALGGPLATGVRALGLDLYVLLFITAFAGTLFWRRRFSLLLHNVRWVGAAGLEFVVFGGVLGLLHPSLSLAGIDLSL